MLLSAPEARAALATLDWSELSRDMRRHGLSAVVSGELERLGITAPQPLAAQLVEETRRRVAAGLLNRRLMRQALETLAAEGIVPVLLKGYGLATRLYTQPLYRPVSDVDLLVAPDEVPRAERALERLGLKRQVDPGYSDVYADYHHVAFVGPAGMVELHFRALTGFGNAALDYALLAPALVSAELEGMPVRFLGPEDELVFLAAHAAKHLFFRVGWLLDIALLLQRSPTLDWSRVEATATRAGLKGALQVAERALTLAFGIQFPMPPAPRGWKVSARVRLVQSLLTEQALVSGRLEANVPLAFAMRALMADRLTAVGRHLVGGAIRGGRRAILGRRSSAHARAAPS